MRKRPEFNEQIKEEHYFSLFLTRRGHVKMNPSVTAWKEIILCQIMTCTWK